MATPAIGRASAWASPLAVAIPTRRPVNAPGPVPTTMPPSAAGATLEILQQPSDPGQELLAVPIAGGPRPDLDQGAVRGTERDDRTRRRRVDREERAARGHATASR